jgi:hypothetical protein
MQLGCFIQIVNPSKKRCLFEARKIGEIGEMEEIGKIGEIGKIRRMRKPYFYERSLLAV